ncbi:MAG: sugar ABC transporter substrate-binding protein, partial [Tabrizicola sp.]|nr:sugar ABC transporter substrate-binding protein [Tabrizicola sp.]
VLIVSVDGGCPGVASVKDGVIGATSQQYPLAMAALGVEAIAKFAADGTKPTPTEGKGVDSIDTTKGTELCWG